MHIIPHTTTLFSFMVALYSCCMCSGTQVRRVEKQVKCVAMTLAGGTTYLYQISAQSVIEGRKADTGTLSR